MAADASYRNAIVQEVYFHRRRWCRCHWVNHDRILPHPPRSAQGCRRIFFGFSARAEKTADRLKGEGGHVISPPFRTRKTGAVGTPDPRTYVCQLEASPPDNDNVAADRPLDNDGQKKL